MYIGSSFGLMNEFKANMMQKYEMTYLGLVYHFLGMRIQQSEHGIFIKQNKYALDLLEKYGLKDCKPMNTP